eukprot:1160429-Pelagomonas_calceolata.AAC.19
MQLWCDQTLHGVLDAMSFVLCSHVSSQGHTRWTGPAFPDLTAQACTGVVIQGGKELLLPSLTALPYAGHTHTPAKTARTPKRTEGCLPHCGRAS